MSKKKKPVSLSLRVSPETFEEYVRFASDEGEVLTYTELSLFYRYDASNLGIIDYNETANTLEFIVPSVDLVIPLNDDVRASIKNLYEGFYIYDLERLEPIWDILQSYPVDYDDWLYVPVREVKTALICSYKGPCVKVDSDGYHQELAYFKTKLSPFSGSEPTVFGITLLSRLILGRRGVSLPLELIQNYLPLFLPSGDRKDSYLKPSQLHSAINIIADIEIDDSTEDLNEIVGEATNEEETAIDVIYEDATNNDDLYDGKRCLSTLVKLPPDKWTSHPQERLKITQDVVISGTIKKIVCRGRNLIFHTPDARLSPSSIVKQLGMPTEYAGNILVVIEG